MLRICTFGGLRIESDGQALQLPGGKTRDLLAYLLLYQGRSFSRDLLAGTFWPDQPEERARRALSQALWQIRSALGPAAGCLVVDEDEITLVLDAQDWCDVVVFEQGYSSFAQHSSAGPSDLAQAVALYQADFLAGCYDDWVLLEQERLRQHYLEMLEGLLTFHKQHGEYEAALTCARQLVVADPLREAIHQELMRLYHLLGREHAALEQYEALRQVLAAELKVEPSAATAALAREIAGRLGGMELPYLPPKMKTTPIFERPECIPLIGRDDERNTLLMHLQSAIGGRGGLILIEGEPGIGKTRLMQELAQDAQWRGAQVCWGRGQELAELPPYNLFREALREALSPLRASQLKALMKAHWLREVGLLLPELGEWLPDLPQRVPLEPGQERTRLLESVTQTVLALGQILPHVLIFDDLQWADAASMSALVGLAGRLAQHCILIVGCYRGEDARRQPAIWDALQTLDQIGGRRRLLLARLNAGQTAEFLRYGMGIIPGASVFEQHLYQETDGNPLFLLETLRALQEDGQLYQDDTGAWKTSWREAEAQGDGARRGFLQAFAAGDVGSSLPAGVCQVINRRLKGLSAEEVAVMKIAAILGGDFDFTLLARASQLSVQAALPVVNKLLWQRFLIEGSHTYRFGHDKIREVVYVGIDEAQRQQLHNRAGQSLEALFPDQIERLAHHFYLGQAWEKAVDYSHQAGRRAREIYAHADAIIYYTQALEACEYLQMPGQVLGLCQERGAVYREMGKLDQAEADFRAAYQLARKSSDTARQIHLLNQLSDLQVVRGNFAAGLELAERSLELATRADLPAEIGSALANKVNALASLGDYPAAIDFAQQAVALYEKLGNAAHLAATFGSLGRIFMFNSNLVEARLFLERSLATYRQIDDKMRISRTLGNLSQLWLRHGDYAQAQEAAREAQEICSLIGDLYGEAFALGSLGSALVGQADIERAMPFLQHALQVVREIGDRAMEPSFLRVLATAYHLRGDLAQAEEMLEQSLALSAVSAIAHDVPLIHAELASLMLETARGEKALFHALAGLEMSEERKELWTIGMMHGLLARAAVQLGAEKTNEHPGDHFEESVRILQALGAEAELACSQMFYGLYLRQSADAEQAARSARMLHEARLSFERLGMTRELAELKAALGVVLPPHQLSVRLPRVGIPSGRPLRDDEYVNVTWTLSMPGDDDIAEKSARRQHRLLRLLQEATDQSAAPTIPDLAAALDVNARTIRRDLAALRTAESKVLTRGSRSAT